MKKIMMLAYANIRKTIGNSISLLIMFLISGLLLNAGLLVFINFGGFFDKTADELNTANSYYLLSSHLYSDEVEKLFTENDNIIEMQKENAIWTNATIDYKGETLKKAFLLNDADLSRTISRWKFVGEHNAPEAMSIYLPAIFQKDGGYKLNDKFVMTVEEERLEFTIKGFTEDVQFSSNETGLYGVYLPHDTFETVADKINDLYNVTLIFAYLKNVNKDLETSIRELTHADFAFATTGEFENTMFSMPLSVVKLSRVMMASAISVMVVVFSIVIASVCIIVIRFRIGNSIEDDMTKIGALKALGYTSRQIILSIVMQFILIALIGCIAGIAISYLITPVLSGVFAQQSGLMWTQGFDLVISSLTLIIIVGIVYAVSVLTSRSINKLHPIVALRGGITTHSFRKNHFPLSTTSGRLPSVLAMKSMVNNLKHSLMIALILLVVSFSGTFAVIMYYNTNVNAKAFYETPGIELSNVAFIANPEQPEIINDIRYLAGVRKAQYLDRVNVKANGVDVSTFVMDDYASKETNTVYDGRYPIHDNEVAISGVFSEMEGLGLGDEIVVSIGDNEETFLISGLTQGSYVLSGFHLAMTSESIRRLKPDFRQTDLQIYLDNETDINEFITGLETAFEGRFVTIMNITDQMERGAGVYITIVSKVGYAILVITILVDFLVLYFMINSSVIRRKRELGIQKALGFTTLQLMNQVSLGFTLPITFGVFTGCLLGIWKTNDLMSMAQRAMGIMKAGFIITPLWIALFGLGLIIVSYLFSMLLTYRIRKISAYVLVTE